jgi:hypothetical protein
MSAKTAKHVLALSATLLAAVASLFQAGKALQKAEHEHKPERPGTGIPRNEHSRESEHRLKAWQVHRHVPTAWSIMKDRKTTTFDTKHFFHVASSWAVITLSSLIAVVAESVDWYAG